VTIVGGRVTRSGVAAPAAELPLAGARFVGPGFVDLQVNGAAGIDITNEPERLWEVAAALPRFGVTSFLPTVVSSPRDVVERALAILAAGPPAGRRGARALGLHLEGPFLSPRRAGAHDPRWLTAPSLTGIDGWQRDRGVALVTLAPELPGAVPVIRELSRRGVVVSLGHTEADADAARRAVFAGARAVTHLFNAMPSMHHRAPGLVGAVLGGLDVVAGLIADGVHLAPDALRVAWRALGPERRLLVSDGAAAMGAPAGGYLVGGTAIVSDGREVRTADGSLAGTAAGLDAGVRAAWSVTGCSRAEAVAAATATPARLLGRDDVGTLREGALGDVVLLGERMEVVATVVGGAVAYRRDGA
jgi:N-acetylglucosamine-6-phosphate deacetylase